MYSLSCRHRARGVFTGQADIVARGGGRENVSTSNVKGSRHFDPTVILVCPETCLLFEAGSLEGQWNLGNIGGCGSARWKSRKLSGKRDTK